ncbi:MAG: hypothetical protein V1679_00560 [Candidatus Peregrinibacteria bacterium]
MENSCKNCSQPFEITEDDLKFYKQVSPIFNKEKLDIPPPTFCPNCRQQRRLSHCNEHFLYPTTCDLCNKKVITEHPPHSNQKKYCFECWHSDKWDPCDYGKDPDLTKPIFPQLYELRRQTPAQNVTQDGFNINSEFMHYAGSSKNCYLIAHADFCENCYYGYGFKKDISCVDGFYNLHCELCYDCVDVYKCYDLKASQDCSNCSSSAFLRDCIGCQNCFLCTGLRNKNYHFENKELTKEEYEEKLAKIDLGSYSQYQANKNSLTQLEKSHIFKSYHGHNNQNSIGDYLKNCKDVQYGFDCEDVDHGKYIFQLVLGAKNVYDIYQYGTNLQESYECCISGADSYHLLFVQDGHMASSDLTYCWYMESCRDCLLCASMHNKRYCILNKQYTQEEYEQLAPKIIEHMKETKEWGEYLPTEISTFGYNKTTAQLYYPLTKPQVLEKGWKWDDYEPDPPKVDKVIKAKDLPDNIKDVTDDILTQAIECEETQKLFRLTPQELKFYQKNSLPLPRKHYVKRHHDRFHKRNPRKFYSRACAKCSAPIKTTYSPDRPETVYCEECYKKAIY